MRILWAGDQQCIGLRRRLLERRYIARSPSPLNTDTDTSHGASRAAARSSAELIEAARRLPERASIFVLRTGESNGSAIDGSMDMNGIFQAKRDPATVASGLLPGSRI